MVSQCSVCDLQTPKLGKHYGATTCYPCRAFFRRAQVRRYAHCTTTKQYISIQCIHTACVMCVILDIIHSIILQTRKRELRCKRAGGCALNGSVKKFCPSCRYDKCLR